MVVLNKTSFKLPRVERDEFSNLMRLGLGYNRNQGCYFIDNYNNIGKLIDTLSSILNTEVVFLQNCTTCSKAFSCSNCKYVDSCATKNLPFECVCPQCLNKETAQSTVPKPKGDLSAYF